MKRRQRTAGTPPPELAEFDPSEWIPAGASDGWAPTRAHEAWCAARSEWVAAGGVWPGGEGQREMQEAIVTPDQPFDPSDL